MGVIGLTFSKERINATLSGRLNENRINLLTPNVNYSGRIAPLASKVAFYIFIKQI